MKSAHMDFVEASVSISPSPTHSSNSDMKNQDRDPAARPSSIPSSPESTIWSFGTAGHDDDAAIMQKSNEVEDVRPSTSRISELFAESRSEEYRHLFHLPPEEVLIRDFNCAVQKNILLQGHMYIFARYICFYSNIFGYEKKRIIPLREITAVYKARTAGIFPNAIEIEAWGKKHFFGSFLSRDEAYRLIIDGWMQHSEYAKLFFGLQDAGVSSSNSDAKSGSYCMLQTEVLTCSKSISREDAEDSQTNDHAHINIASSDGKEESNNREALVNESIVQDGANNVGEQLVTEISTIDAFAEELIVQGKTACSVISWRVEDMNSPRIPEGYKMVAEAKFSMDVKEFFQLFFSDDARRFLANFHNKCNDEDFHCKRWSKDKHVGYVREISFRHPVNLYFGSKFANCQEVQRFRVYRNSYLVIETSQQMADVPYADSFRVEGRWDVETVTVGVRECALRIFVNVAFSKKVFWKGKIEQGAYDECRKVYSSWIDDANTLLQHREGGIVNENNVIPRLETLPKSEQDAEEMVGTGLMAENSRVLPSDKENNQYGKSINRNGHSKDPTGLPFPKSCDSNSIAFLLKQLHSYILNNWKSWNQPWLILVLAFALLFMLSQVTVILVCTKQPKVLFIPETKDAKQAYSCPRVSEYHRTEIASWLEQRIFFLGQEMSVLEARMKAIHNELEFLKLQMQSFDPVNINSKLDVSN